MLIRRLVRLRYKYAIQDTLFRLFSYRHGVTWSYPAPSIYSDVAPYGAFMHCIHFSRHAQATCQTTTGYTLWATRVCVRLVTSMYKSAFELAHYTA